MVAATHGRSLWILDITPLRQMSTEVAKAKAHLFEPITATRWRTEPRKGGTNRRFVGEVPPGGAQIYYSLANKADKVSLSIVDYTGKTVRELRATGDPGLHKVAWALAMAPARPARAGAEPATPAAGTEPGARGGRRQRQPGSGPAGGGQAAPAQPGAAPEAGAAPQPGAAQPGAGQRGGGRGAGGGGGRGGPGAGARAVAPGTYRVILTV